MGIKRAIREVMDNVTQPRRGAKADTQREAVRLARETKNVRIDPQAAAKGDKFSRDVVMARLTANQVKSDVAKRKAKLQ